MTPNERAAHFQALHNSLDRLLAEFLFFNRGRVPSNTTVEELMQWSYQQTQNPQQEPEGNLDDLLRHFVETGLRAQQAVAELIPEPKK